MKSPSDAQLRASRRWNGWPNYLAGRFKNPKHFVDVGANIGYSALFFARHFPSVIITAIEPVERNYKYLRINTAKTRHIVTVNVALGSEEGELTLSMSEDSDNLGKMSAFGSGRRSETVPMTTLDLLLIDHVDFIKIDVEGYELEVLKGAAQTLERYGPLIQMESNDEAEAWLLNHGYVLKTKWQGDWLFKRLETDD